MKNKKSIKKIPKSLINDFTLNGEVELIYEYSDGPDIVIEKYEILEENIKKMVEKIKKHEKFSLSEDGLSGSSYPALDKCFYGIVNTNDYDLKNKLEKGITLSRQSNDKEVLKIIKRGNIKMSTYVNLQKRFNEARIPVYSELILGLRFR